MEYRSNLGTGRLVANVVKLAHQIDERYQGVPQAEVQSGRRSCSSCARPPREGQVFRGVCSTTATRSTRCLSSSANEIINEQENVESFEPCQLFRKVQCGHRLQYTSPGHISCRCGTLLPEAEEDPEVRDQMRRRTQERYDSLTSPMILKKALLSGRRFGHSQGHEQYHRARKAQVNPIRARGRHQHGWTTSSWLGRSTIWNPCGQD